MQLICSRVLSGLKLAQPCGPRLHFFGIPRLIRRVTSLSYLEPSKGLQTLDGYPIGNSDSESSQGKQI